MNLPAPIQDAAERLHQARPKARQLRKLALAVAFWMLAALTGLAEVGVGESGLFLVDTRWLTYLGMGTSSYFTVDTRYSASRGEEVSGLFTLDTRGATTGTATIAGRVMDSGGLGLGGAAVSALLSGVIRAQTAADASGHFTLSPLAAGAYDLRVEKPGYRSGVAYGISVANGQTILRDFALTPMPDTPVIEAVNRTPDSFALNANSQLMRFVKDVGWVAVTSAADLDRSKNTIVMTHGWTGSAKDWPLNMAANFIASGVGPTANVLAWDWSDNADGPLSTATSYAPGDGRRLGQELADKLGTHYQQGIHFIGKSLGTLVNAAAANYLHKETEGAFDWHRTQMTLLDNAELANVNGLLVRMAYTVPGFESRVDLGDPPPLGWIFPLPEQWQWSDNYISLVGFPHSSVVNIFLPNGIIDRMQFSDLWKWAESAHGYACDWYSETVQNPNLSELGNRFSFERLGVNAQFPSPSPYPVGSLLTQDPFNINDYELSYVVDVNAFFLNWNAMFAQSMLLNGVSALVGTGQKIGDAVVDVAEAGVAVMGDVVAGANRILSQSVASLSVTLHSVASVLPAPRQGLALAARDDLQTIPGTNTNSPSAVWLPIQIPPNAALFSFDFKFSGDAGGDMLSASLNATNLFALETRDMPTGQLLNSGPIDVTPWKGQTVELFFGLLGGASTNTTISISAMRFYELDRPLLAAEVAGTNLLVSWPATATGYTLESSDTLTATNWPVVTNTPTVSGLRQYITNDLSGECRFYRLKRN